MTNHYDDLQVQRTASDGVIRAAYKSLAQKYHPDRFTGDPAEADRIMKLLNKAYFVLSDPIKRRQHDEWIDTQSTVQNSNANATENPEGMQGQSAEEHVVRAKRRTAIFFFLFSVCLLVYALSSWFTPIGGEGWTGTGSFGLPQEWEQIFERFIGTPFALFGITVFGRLAIFTTIMIITPQGIRFSDNGGHLYRWSEIAYCEESGRYIKLRGVRNGKKWERLLIRSMIDENLDELVRSILKCIQSSGPPSSNAWPRKN